MSKDRRVAVIGMALRFPGADCAQEYWRDIAAGVTHVRRFTRAEFRAAGVPAEQLDDPSFTGASALLDGVDRFDAAFFGMSGREAALTDPQQRLFLECCHHALEDAGYAGSPARIGVYGSVGYRLYSLHSYLGQQLAGEAGDDWTAQKQVQVGTYPDFTANRAAFRLGLRGPAVNVATACSSALVSVHLACQALLAGDAELMVVGSAALHLPQITGHRHVKGSTISPTGAVRAFDADADGTVGGNGVAAVVLKPLRRALADGDTVHAVILGSAVTNDGDGKAGFAAPGVAGQRDAVLDALARAGVPADTIGYVEAHGTGTYKGDPIEFAALTEAFRRHTGRTGFCALGSTKPAIGHLDSAAGLAGLIKAVLVLRHGVIPPLVNFRRANPLLGVDDSPFVLPTRTLPWPLDGVRRAGVHSIGMGGTNAHVILEQAPARSLRGSGESLRAGGSEGTRPTGSEGTRQAAGREEARQAAGRGETRQATEPEETLRPMGAEQPRRVAGREETRLTAGREGSALVAGREGLAPVVGRGAVPPGAGREAYRTREVPPLLPLSAHTPEALTALARTFRDTLARRPELDPADVVTTAALGRRRLRHRVVVPAPFVAGLDAFLAGDERAAVTGTAPDGEVRPAFLFSGQGSGGPGMAAALAERFPVVADVLRECAEVYREESEGLPFPDGGESRGDGGESFLARVTGGSGPARWDTAFAQPALFALQVAQARLWRHLGIRPARVAGHSVGEYAALCAAGALSPADGMRLLCRRGRLMRDTAPGAMLAVFAPRERVERLLADVDGLDLAVVNGPEQYVVAGPPEAVAAARRTPGLRAEPLAVDRAFHSALLDPVLDKLREAAEETELRPVEVEFVSGLDGAVHRPGWRPDPAHLVRQARHTADFHAVLRTLADKAPLLELGPGATLTGLVRRALPGAVCVPTQHSGRDLTGLWAAVARLHCAGAGVDWAALLQGCAGRRIPLPTYPFQHRSYWIGPPPRPVAGPSVNRPEGPDGENDVTERAVLDRVLELTARHLGHEPGALRAAESYVGLGADSLQLIGMVRQLEGEFGVRIALRELLEEAGSPELTARLIAERRREAGREPAEIPGPAGLREPAEIPGPAGLREPAGRPVPEPTAPVAGVSRDTGAPPAQADDAPYATRAEVAELRRQIDVLAETQAALITQLSEAVALLDAGRTDR